MSVVSKNSKMAAAMKTTQTRCRWGPILRVSPDRASSVTWDGRVLCVALLELRDVQHP